MVAEETKREGISFRICLCFCTEERVFKWCKNILDRVLLPKEVFLKYFKIFVSKGLFRNEFFFFLIFWVESIILTLTMEKLFHQWLIVCVYIYILDSCAKPSCVLYELATSYYCNMIMEALDIYWGLLHIVMLELSDHFCFSSFFSLLSLLHLLL